MKTKTPIPQERKETVRQELLSVLQGGAFTVGSLSKLVGKSEKEIYDHLEHLQKTGSLKIEPARCGKCDYVFEDRSRVKKPGKCPQCKGTFIDEPVFSAKSR
ncbi:predicted transcriptional regulator containing an HTH domain fused to a Zn-ribbon [Hahella chejuensis KCTC 2396]|uniref:Predicted transcriptional regulator containing an HTH domain fused to a Zn-ribbon n=1 Tax=Hahella chejuensis (strain KCTC 2396) TaxID=349521 RepID=Q2SAW1_HAHCH|nr:transcriptional regulator [Hahella chejuensis]ABC32213.1 predicted transcriptional regulator containing an HTH domain fused to a Zn-ribbon [Hahella chejuensis KCTC 2396]